MKQDSADGRLLMWKVTVKAIAGQPLAGTGLGGFPAAYAEAQGGYFATGNATDREKRVAGCPEYAFNEYLQIGLEQGVGGLIVFVAWLGNMAYYGIRNRQQGAAGGVLALAVFAVSSYPLQLPSFWVALVLGSGAIGLSQMTALNIALFITAAWWLAMTLPLLKTYRQLHYVEVEKHAIRQSFARIGHTLRHLHEDKQVFWFLLAFFCYIDGVYTIIDMATAYGTALGLDTTGLLLALLVTQIVAFPSALIFGRLSAKYPSTTLIPVCIAAYAGIALFAFFLTQQWQFWVLAVLVGLFQGGVQALSRSHFAKITPPEKSGEYFGLFDICGKGASFLGTMIVSVGSQLTGSANVGVGSLIVLFIVGFVLFRVSCKEGVITE
jgi:MFS-type transporter involved in bile tolerance (Atg22 family)